MELSTLLPVQGTPTLTPSTFAMALSLQPIYVLLTLAIAASNAVSVPPEQYWKSMLPNTPIPDTLRTRLDFVDEENTVVGVGKGGVGVVVKGKPGGTSVHVGKGGVAVHSGKGKPGGTSVNVGKGGVGVHAGKGKPGGGTGVAVGGKGKGVAVSAGKPGHRTNVGVGKGGVAVHTGHKGKPVVVGVHPGPNPFIYKYAATEDQLHDNPDVALFFLEKDLRPGTQMKLQFTHTADGAAFLPRATAESIPFSSDKLPEALNSFSVAPASAEAESMRTTVRECEEPGVAGEEKYCATSLESMVDFSTARLGRWGVRAVATESGSDEHPRKYTVAAGVRKVGRGEQAVACHRQAYPYAVFYCHETRATRTYAVPLEGEGGARAEAVAVCHSDTASWNPNHLAFRVLKVRPGTVPICHFLPDDHVVWVAN